MHMRSHPPSSEASADTTATTSGSSTIAADNDAGASSSRVAVSGFGATGRKPNRAKARLDKRAAASEAMKKEAELELKANGGQPDEALRERKGIDELCKALQREVHEVEADGHCLYAAVADQVNLLRARNPKLKEKEAEEADALTYKDTRKAAATEMRSHPDEFAPFISDSDEKMAGIINASAGHPTGDRNEQEGFFRAYCDAVENTGVWGGHTEILALSRAFKTQINVVQVGYPTLKIGEGDYEGKGDAEVAFISYHRKMYGLGEVSCAVEMTSLIDEGLMTFIFCVRSITTRSDRRFEQVALILLPWKNPERIIFTSHIV